MPKIDFKMRSFIFNKTFHYIDNYFVFKENHKLDIDSLYFEFADRLLTSSDWYKFGLLMKELISKLKNSHSNYWDGWFNKYHAQPLGFYAGYHDIERKWIILFTNNKKINVGDIITKVNGVSTYTFFKKNCRYLSASNERASKNKLFSDLWLFPNKFDIVVNNKTTVKINRKTLSHAPNSKTIIKIIEPNVAYIKVPNFWDSTCVRIASKYVKKFNNYKKIILDLRGNEGGKTPLGLMSLLMNKRYKRLNYDTLTQKTATELIENITDNKMIKLKHHISKYRKPSNTAFNNKLIILVNEHTGSAAEDFVFSFKENKRATILGNITHGSIGDPYLHVFTGDVNRGVSIGAVLTYNDMSQIIEGTGIKPDKIIIPSVQDLKFNRDIVFDAALKE